MEMTDPKEFLDEIDVGKLKEILQRRPIDNAKSTSKEIIHYQEPFGLDNDEGASKSLKAPLSPTQASNNHPNSAQAVIEGKALVVGDFIDTDAIISSKFLASGSTDDALGPHCMEFFMPEFRQMVKDGQNIVVGGRGFGVGSSRDVAVNALKGSGVKAVIARSFAFIYARNQPNLGLVGITITDDAFYKVAVDGASICIDLEASRVDCSGKLFPFTLSSMEKKLIAAGGITEAFKKFGAETFNRLCKPVNGNGRQEPSIGDVEDTAA
jgi:3-isopropylmalate dehydratase small subunit